MGLMATITINEDGSRAKVDAVGYLGADCMETADIEKALGTVVSDQHKPEYYKQGDQGINQA